jgi:hypothetical protein
VGYFQECQTFAEFKITLTVKKLPIWSPLKKPATSAEGKGALQKKFPKVDVTKKSNFVQSKSFQWRY